MLWQIISLPILAQRKNHARDFAAEINTGGDCQHGDFMVSLATYPNSNLAKQLNHQSLVARKENIVTVLQLGTESLLK